jgi:hypothetical protein
MTESEISQVRGLSWRDPGEGALLSGCNAASRATTIVSMSARPILVP